MATMDSIEIIREIIKKDGYYEGDPRVYQIVKYINYNGGVSYGVTWENETIERQHRYEVETEYVNGPRIIWRADSTKFTGDIEG